MKRIILCFMIAALTSVATNAQNRVVLIEQFSNSSCPPCGAISPSVYAFANNNQNSVAVIAYHTQFPYNNDSMYFENPVEATHRVNYYSVSGVPHSVLDGNIYSGSTTSFFPNISSLTNAQLSVAPRYSIEATSLTLAGKQLSGSFQFTSINAMNASDNLVAHIVVIEKNVLKSSYAAAPGVNNETEYGYVMRKMIPNAEGTSLVNRAMNGTDNIPLSWTLNNIKNKDELRIVAFVQNKTTKEIYQTRLLSVSAIPAGISENKTTGNQSIIYPNPTSGEFYVAFQTPQYLKSITILNQIGTVIFEEKINLTTDELKKKTNLSAGVYLVKIDTASGIEVQKIIITP